MSEAMRVELQLATHRRECPACRNFKWCPTEAALLERVRESRLSQVACCYQATGRMDCPDIDCRIHTDCPVHGERHHSEGGSSW